MINIILPTIGRLDMLRQALRSVNAQTARHRISRVLVSENGGNRETGSVCREFPGLPIHYVFRDPQLTPLDHHQSLLGDGLQDTYTAILHDDDWWGPDHLAQALQALERVPQAAAYHSSVFEVAAESSPLGCDANFCFWFGAGFPRIDSVWETDRLQVLLAALLMTPGRFSSLVARTPLLKAASPVFKDDIAYDTDRKLTVMLSRAGSILYNPVPQVFIRYHESQDQKSFARERSGRIMAHTTDWMIETAGIPPLEIARHFLDAVRNCPLSGSTLLHSYLVQPWCVARLAARPDMGPGFQSLDHWVRRHQRRQSLKRYVPPILFEAKQRLWVRLGRKASSARD